MRLTRWNAWTAVPAAAGLVVAAAALPGTAAASAAGSRAAAQGPVVKLIVAQDSITLPSVRGRVYLDPGVYVASLGSALQFDVRRASYTKPITLTQVIYRPGGGTTSRSLPGSLLHGFNGLRDFLRLSVADAAGQVVASTRPLFCLNFGPAVVTRYASRPARRLQTGRPPSPCAKPTVTQAGHHQAATTNNAHLHQTGTVTREPAMDTCCRSRRRGSSPAVIAVHPAEGHPGPSEYHAVMVNLGAVSNPRIR